MRSIYVRAPLSALLARLCAAMIVPAGLLHLGGCVSMGSSDLERHARRPGLQEEALPNGAVVLRISTPIRADRDLANREFEESRALMLRRAASVAMDRAMPSFTVVAERTEEVVKVIPYGEKKASEPYAFLRTMTVRFGDGSKSSDGTAWIDAASILGAGTSR